MIDIVQVVNDGVTVFLYNDILDAINSWGFVGAKFLNGVLYVVTVICLGHNKDLWSQRSKYKSYGALRGCNLGARDCLQVCCGK